MIYDFDKVLYEKIIPSHDSYDFSDDEIVSSICVYEYEPDLIYVDLGNSHLHKKEALALIEALKEAVEVMEDW